MINNTRYIFMDTNTLKTCIQGALGAMTFGMYHQFTTNKMMELNNELIRNENEKISNEIKEMKDENQKILNEIKRENEMKKNYWLF